MVIENQKCFVNDATCKILWFFKVMKKIYDYFLWKFLKINFDNPIYIFFVFL